MRIKAIYIYIYIAENIFHVYIFILFDWQNIIRIIVSVVENNSGSLNQIRKSSISAIIQRCYKSNKRIVIYHKNETEARDITKVEALFPDKTRLDDTIKRIKETISFTLILSSTLRDAVVCLYYGKKHIYNDLWIRSTLYELPRKNWTFFFIPVAQCRIYDRKPHTRNKAIRTAEQTPLQPLAIADSEDGTEVTLSSLFYFSCGYVATSACARGCLLSARGCMRVPHLCRE